MSVDGDVDGDHYDDEYDGNQGDDDNGGHHDRHRRPPTNERLLCIAFVSFTAVSVSQMIASVLSDSEALLADASAMLVDAATYLFNWYAERRKEQYRARRMERDGADVGVGGGRRSWLLLQKYTLQLEIVPPLVSVTTLLAVTGFTLKDAISVLVADVRERSGSAGDEEPNVVVMMVFSVLNLLLDCLNVTCFASASHALGYRTAPAEGTAAGDGGAGVNDEPARERENVGDSAISEPSSSPPPMMELLEVNGGLPEGEKRRRRRDGDGGSNLNMCSAYTHVFADSMRTTAMILASLLAILFPQSVSPEVADASAAVTVSVLIVLTLVPLITGMVRSFWSLRRVNAELLLLHVEGGEEEGGETQREIIADYHDGEGGGGELA